MNQARIVWLDARADTNDSVIGPKAFSLVRLSRIGLTVPAGFCITADAYREHVEVNGIIRQLATAPPEQRESILPEIRAAIVRAPMTEATRQAIETHYRKMGARWVAIRSSATAEDLPGQSFAGQYDTYLGIADLDACLAAVQQCWASLWTQRAWEYRQQNGFDHLAARMAVIVQSLVPADASGVLFTADPTTGRSDRITIEACFGLGEALVSGRVTPDRFLIRKRDLHLLSRTISDKTVESVPAKQGGVRQLPVTPERMPRAAIDRPIALRLARLAKRAEAKLGGPQDIEWAVRGRNVFFLQARPITTIPGARSWEDRQVWTNANLGEVLPDVMTPMTYSFTDVTDETLLRPVLTILGLETMDKGKLQRLIAGRLYFNASMGLAIIRHLPGAQHFDYRALVGGDQAAASESEFSDLAEEVPDLKVSTAKIVLRIPWSIRLMLAHRQEKARVSIQEMQAINCRLQDLDFSRMSLEELGRRFATDIQDGVARFDLLYAVLTTAPLAILYKVCERWLGDTGGTLANSLLADTGDMASAQAGIDLGRLAAQARAVPPVRDVLLSEGDWHILREKLLTLDEGRAFLRSWDRFMACHGHHCRGELEFYNPRWSEMPDYLLKLVRGYLVQTDVRDPRQDHQERTRRREQLWEQCRRQLRNPVKRMIFDRVLRAARSGSVLRENFKNEGIRWTALLRRMLLEIGVRLAATGVLQEPDDVFFLQLQELDALLHGGSEILGRTPSPAKPTPGWQRQAPACRWFARSPSAKPSALPLPPAFPSPQVQFGSGLHIRELIAARRAEYERNRSLTPPKVVVGRFDPDQPVPEAPTVSENAEVLHGVAASAGMATGQARVILRAETDEHVQAGEILVAPFTDPGWTPYFVPAAGIVTDQGGLLSHGSIIAREYGIPAVVNVPAATRIIKTGQRLRVDGNRGLVTILP